MEWNATSPSSNLKDQGKARRQGPNDRCHCSIARLLYG
ncbi:hypothetical protein JMJ77_0005398 [Colletotrichum scovillei]|uniref:Uncharacterized protein n=1 Tax=Colletotrichum scovillei TaxID=1209932 RepID=A0A9P7RIY4_9PEZI|nr:hypothetical protein JMJ77_0005398 [Colletotrichum scovillei]KAG7076615.1 hypothetical protein JMJ76_0013877 [Colletotrichum scovillei]KAG7083725.1 hypothetical protein JMJ78_0009168 [Colletotrichum scovillei]